LAGCGETSKPFEAEHVYEPVGAPIRWEAGSAERFRLSRAQPNSATAAPATLQWTTPPGWSELPATAMRSPNFRVAGDARAECYLTTLSGEGGGLAANINRWRSQMSQPDLTQEELAGLPRLSWFGQSGTFVQIDGTWTGMGGTEDAADYRLLGAVTVTPESSRFLKMIGPRDVVERETDAFRALVASFRIGKGTANVPQGSSAPLAGGSAGAGAGTSAAGPAAAGTLPSAATASSSIFRWTVPAGWKVGPQKAMREVTLLGGPQGDVECYVTALGGEAGGLLSNLNRWRDQMGRAALDEQAALQLPQIPMLGKQATWMEVARSEDPGADAVLGAACVDAQRSVFVKMLGKKAAIEREREAFLAFCRSLSAER
jgi:hypothetical protein